MLIHPAQSFDLQGDTAVGGFLDVNKYTSSTPMLRGEVGKIYGARVVESPNVFINAGAGSGGADTYHGFMFGKAAYGNVDLAGQNMKMFAKQLGSAGSEDPLDQRSTVGYKFSHVTKVLEAARAIQMYTLAS
jgi:N4-gp56 family major capsid protein